jgi:hypothetical protein
LSVRALQCEHRTKPINIDSVHPRLSWELASDYRGEGQSAYQILVASSQDKLNKNNGDCWDSGKVISASPLDHAYGGRALRTDQTYFYKVRVWDAKGHRSRWSDPEAWQMSLLSPGDWKAKWIGSPTTSQTLPIFRKRFVITKPVRAERLHICGLGQYEARLDGMELGKEVLQPGWTLYSKTCLYVTYNFTAPLRIGEHALAVNLGNGMYNLPETPGRYVKFHGSFGEPKLIAQLDIEYEDGSRDCVVSDETWKVSNGPITFSSVYGGEDFDARIVQRGWDRAAFDDQSWSHAKVVRGPGGELAAASRSALPIDVMRTFSPVAVTHPKAGVDVYDMGQNCAMVPVIVVRGQTGSIVLIRPGELLDANGLVTQRSTGGPTYFSYTLRGDKEERWKPQFTYMGSRYFQVEKIAAKNGGMPQVLAVRGEFISSSSPEVGEFSCSNELFNRTDQLIRWAMRSNMMSILTDCPHRERLGWLEQDYLNGPGLMDNFSLPTLFEKIAGDMRDSQLADGLVPDIAPEYTVFSDGFRDSPEWGSASIQVPWQAYESYGDEKILRDSYAMMRRYVAYLGTQAKDHILSYGLGDWFDLGPRELGESQLTPKGLTATAIYYHDVQTLAHIAKILGDSAEAKKMDGLVREIRAAFNHQFYHANTHEYATGSQTANAMPYVFRMEPPADASALLNNIVADVRQRGNALTAGDVGYRYVLEALATGDRSDVIFDMNNQTTRPGYGYQLAHGATSLTEAWDAHAFSQDHFMLGHIMQWFYGELAGIRQMPGSVGFEHIQIRPNPVGNVTWARATYHSVRGMISSSWRKSSGKFSLEIQIPPGADATVYIPAASENSVEENGIHVRRSAGVHWLRSKRGVQVFSVDSGHYQFTSVLPPELWRE